MKNISMLVLLALSMSATSNVYAQDQGISVEVDNEIDQMYRAPAPRKSPQQSSGNVVTQTFVVPQQSQQAVQTQPTTLIEASPLTDSRADMIRKNRQEEEMRTESRIVEKLEQSRMEDEKKRASALFGDKFDSMHTTAPTAVQAPPPVVVTPVYIEPKQHIQPKEELSREAVREEVRAALKDDDTAVTSVYESSYFAGLAGIGEYPDVNNVKGNYALGAAFGNRYDYFLVEGAFLMSNYSVDMKNTIGVLPGAYRTDNYDVNQYQGIIAAKYQLLGGIVRPVLGGLISYSYRQFSLTNGSTSGSQDTGNSHAIDLGINTGVDLELNPKFSIGLDIKYMFNLSSRVNSSYANSTYTRIGTPIEKLQYYIMGIAARVNF